MNAAFFILIPLFFLASFWLGVWTEADKSSNFLPSGPVVILHLVALVMLLFGTIHLIKFSFEQNLQLPLPDVEAVE